MPDSSGLESRMKVTAEEENDYFLLGTNRALLVRRMPSKHALRQLMLKGWWLVHTATNGACMSLGTWQEAFSCGQALNEQFDSGHEVWSSDDPKRVADYLDPKIQ